MSILSVDQVSSEYRIRQSLIAPSNYRAIDAIPTRARYPIARASERSDGRWFITSGPELARVAGDEFRFPPTFYVDNDKDARTWVEMLAALYVKATA